MNFSWVLYNLAILYARGAIEVVIENATISALLLSIAIGLKCSSWTIISTSGGVKAARTGHSKEGGDHGSHFLVCIPFSERVINSILIFINLKKL